MSEIKQYPKIPKEIIEAIDTQTLIIFVGAGLSALFKLPLWKDFANKLVNKCHELNVMTLSEKEYLINSSFTSMQIITIAYNRLCHKINVEEAQEIFLSYLRIDNDKQPIEIIDNVSKYLSNYCCPIITTNADLSLDNTKYFNIYNNIENFLDWNEETELTKIIHLHGSINDFNSLIFTSEQYAKAYSVDSPFGIKLGKLFSDSRKTILFIGCSLSEFELLRYFIKIRNKDDSNLHLLNGYLDSEILKYEFDKEYFSSLGINLIPFSREKNDYAQLINVLNKWDYKVRTSTLAHLGINRDYSAALENCPNKNSIKFINGKLNEDFDKKLIKSFIDSEYLFDWLKELKDSKLFSINKNINSKNASNYFSIVDGINLLNYCINRLNNEEVIEFVKVEINKIYSYLLDNKLLNRKLNDNLIDNIFNLLLKNEKLFNTCHTKDFFNLYTKSRYFYLYSIFESISNFSPKLVDSKLIFELYKEFYNLKDIAECLDLFTSDKMFKFIYLNPTDYFEFSQKNINDFSPYSAYAGINSIYSCMDLNKYGYSNPFEIINAKVLLNTSKLIETDKLVGLVTDYLISDKRHIKMFALAIININFDRLQDIFINNIELFFKDETYYNDLCLLVEHNYNNFNENLKEKVLNCITDASWIIDENKLNLLKKHLLNIVSRYNNKIVYVTESDEEQKLINDFDKIITIRNITNDIDNEFTGKTFDQALKIYSNNNDGTKLKLGNYAQGFAKYLLKNVSDVIPHIEQLDAQVLSDFYFYYKDNDFLLELSRIILDLNIDGIESLYNSILKIIDNSLLDKADECFELFNKINRSIITGNNKFTKDDYLFRCLNHTLYLYIRVLLLLAYYNKIDQICLSNTIRDLLSEQNNHIVKGCLAMNLDIILVLNNQNFKKEYINDLIDTILNNQFENINLSYIGIGMSNNINSVNYFISRDDLYNFLELNETFKEIKNSQTSIYCKIIVYYLYGNNCDIDKIIQSLISSKNLECILDVLSYLPTNFENLNKDRIVSLFKMLNLPEILNLIKDYEIPNYLRNLNKFVLSYEYSKSILDFYMNLLKVSECNSIIDFKEIIIKYKDNLKYKNLIIRIIDYSIKSYIKFKYLKTKMKVYIDLLKENTLFKVEYKKWLNRLTKEDSSFID